MRIWDERHAETQQVVAIHIDISNFQQRRTVWMDGRPHPSRLAEHTWMGFSTGRWEGETLVVTTTHIKQMWHRRNGLPQSDQVTLTERFFAARPGARLRHHHRRPGVSDRAAGQDHQHAAQPAAARAAAAALSRARPSSRSPSQPRGAVPHYLPGQNAFLKEFAEAFKLPEAAVRGGAATMYPEFAATMRK